MPLASARQHPENQKENQAGHSSERTVEGQRGGGDRPWVHSPRAEGPGLIRVGGRARSPGEGRGRGGSGRPAPSAGSPPRRGGRLGWPQGQSGVWSMSSVVLVRRCLRGGDLDGSRGALAAGGGGGGGGGLRRQRRQLWCSSVVQLSSSCVVACCSCW